MNYTFLPSDVGRIFSCYLGETFCPEATLQIEEGRYYICQNVVFGSPCLNKLGFEASYVFSNGRGSGISNVQFKDNINPENIETLSKAFKLTSNI